MKKKSNILPPLDEIEYSEEGYLEETSEELTDLNDEDLGNVFQDDKKEITRQSTISSKEYYNYDDDDEDDDEDDYNNDGYRRHKIDENERVMVQSMTRHKKNNEKELTRKRGPTLSNEDDEEKKSFSIKKLLPRIDFLKKYRKPILITFVSFIFLIILIFVVRGMFNNPNREEEVEGLSTDITVLGQKTDEEGILQLKVNSNSEEEFEFVETGIATESGIVKCILFDVKLENGENEILLKDCDGILPVNKKIDKIVTSFKR